MTKHELEHIRPGDSIIVPWADDEFPIIEAGELVFGRWRFLSWRRGCGVDGAMVAAGGPEILGRMG